jgi:hypothetical protein
MPGPKNRPQYFARSGLWNIRVSGFPDMVVTECLPNRDIQRTLKGHPDLRSSHSGAATHAADHDVDAMFDPSRP